MFLRNTITYQTARWQHSSWTFKLKDKACLYHKRIKGQIDILLHSQPVLLRNCFALTTGAPYGKKSMVGGGKFAPARNRNPTIEPAWIIKKELLDEWEVSPKHPYSCLPSHYIVSQIGFIIGTHGVGSCRRFRHSSRRNAARLGSCIGSHIRLREPQSAARTQIPYLKIPFMEENKIHSCTHKTETRRVEIWWGEGIFTVHLILPETASVV
jgi:hypothetical protein